LAGQEVFEICRLLAMEFLERLELGAFLNPPYSSKAEGIGCVRLKAL
jgi:hypothetical protein